MGSWDCAGAPGHVFILGLSPPEERSRRWAGAIGLCPRGCPTKLACDPPGEGLEVWTKVAHSSMNEYSGPGMKLHAARKPARISL